jgi:nucleotide-binding universal stress UspA family protein
MIAALKPGWSKPSTILFAAEIPVDEKAFSFALAQAVEFGARLILFHSYDTLMVTESENSGVRYYDAAAAAHLELQHLEPLAARVREAGVNCETVLRSGQPAEQILGFTSEREVDRIVMGTHAPGPIGKLLVGSVAEAVLRSARVPVCIIGPEVVSGRYHNFTTRTILCGVSLHDSSSMVVGFAAELAAEQGARLILQHMIRPQERQELLAGRSIDQIETEMLALVPEELKANFVVQSIVVSGDPAEELLYWSSAEQADLIVLGAQGASAFAAVTCQGVVYKMLAHAPCPVMTLSPVVLESGSAADSAQNEQTQHKREVFLAGVF